MIKNLQLHFGSNAQVAPLSFEPGSVTVFVGPNNSGKSLILREIENFIKRDSPDNSIRDHITQRITLEDLEIDDLIDFVHQSNPNISFSSADENLQVVINARNVFNTSPMMGTMSQSLTVKDLHTKSAMLIQNPIYKRIIASARTIRLDGSTRLNLTNPAQSHNLKQLPQNLLVSILMNDDARKKIREFTFDAFGYYFVIDATGMNQLSVGMSHRSPLSGEELSFGVEGRTFHKDTQPIEEFSDGIKAYTGIVAAIFSGKYELVLIDEPEAFLHPPLARKLGRVISKRATEQKGHVFASTHSADFLLGCVQSGSSVNVVRLTYDKNLASARLLPSIKLQTMMRDPLLRSTGVLSALFHHGTIVCEGDIDRVLYEEVNDRLINEKKGADDVLFVNAIGKQTIHRIIKPLREVGIPAAAIVDLDIIKEGDLGALLRAAFVPEPLIQNWNDLKSKTNGEFKKLGKDPKKFGISILPSEAQDVAKNLIGNIAEYGVFIVPVGEVERWLDYIGATGEKTLWLVRLLELLGSDPKSKGYILPRADDVWDFINQIAKWLSNPQRKGISAG